MPTSEEPRVSPPDLRSEYAAAAAHARRTAVLASVESLLGWDEQTMLPPAGGAYRADQAAAVASLVHTARTEPAQRDRLERLATSMEGGEGDWSDEERVTVLRLLCDLRKQLRLPARLVEEIAALKPDIYTKAGDYTFETIDRSERAALLEAGTEIRFLQYVAGHSTTASLRKLATPSPS